MRNYLLKKIMSIMIKKVTYKIIFEHSWNHFDAKFRGRSCRTLAQVSKNGKRRYSSHNFSIAKKIENKTT
jgi:hypothetical protein